MSRFRVPVLCAAWLLAARLPGQDLTIVSKTAFGNTEGTSTHFITSHRSRSSSRDNDSIVSFADGKVTFVDRRRKEYWEATAEEMEDHWRGPIPPSTFEVPAGYKRVRSPLER